MQRFIKLDYVNAEILRSTNYALFESHVYCTYIIWGQNVCIINLLFTLQKKALTLVHFKERNAH